MLNLIVALAIPVSTVILVALLLFYLLKAGQMRDVDMDNESQGGQSPNQKSRQQELDEEGAEEEEDLFLFRGGEDLTICDLLEAPGEVIGKSNCGTLYKALLQQQQQHPQSRRSGSNGSLRLLRFLRPAACTARTGQFLNAIELLGSIRHPNLVPLLGFYSGPRGEKLLIYPFYRRGNLAQFIQDGSRESHKWATIYKISIGIARGLDHLHTGTGAGAGAGAGELIMNKKPNTSIIIHGNLKSKNILLDRNHEPRISDFGLNLLLNSATCQEILNVSATEGYKAPELVNMKDANVDTDIYNLGVILLELVTGSSREPIYDKAAAQLVGEDQGVGATTTEEEGRLLKLFQLGMACCSPSPSLRPTIKQVLRKLEEIGLGGT